VSIQLQIPHYLNIHNGLDDGELLFDQISEPLLDEMSVPQLKNFLMALNLGFL
jgi:hypothetical protein